MSTTAAPQAFYDVIDERTQLILNRRRAGGVVRQRGWLVRRALLAADVVGLTTAFLVAQQVFEVRGRPDQVSPTVEFLTFALSLPLWIVASKLYGLYDRDEERADHSTTDDFARVFHLVTVCTFLLYAGSHVTAWFSPQFSKLFLFWLLAVVGVTLLRAFARAYCRRQIHYLQNTLIIGAGDIGQSLAAKLLNHPEYGLNLVGFLDANPKERKEALQHLTVLGGLDDLANVVELLDVERVIVAFTNDHHEHLLSTLASLRSKNVQVDIVPRLFDNLGPRIDLHVIEGVPLIGLPPARMPRSSVFVKRALDLVLVTCSAVAVLPVLLFLALLIKLDSRGPVFYRHKRIGRGGCEFGVLKLRTMHRDACRGDEYGAEGAEELFNALMMDPESRAEFETTYKLRNDPRVTRIGRWLRRTSLDEFPQLWNVFRGDMSLVGPRALTRDELATYYGSSAEEILSIRPGITGYWQINGRSRLGYEDRVRLDHAYVRGWSLQLDLAIVAKTIPVLLRKSDAC